ncbi:MAG TPA: hypothetical protein VK536_01125 [Candidatus Limnocylindrales bacterium]|nr:hypothetical protein [Candidatus Limnocylindrales bacterium]
MSDVNETCSYVDKFITDILNGNIEVDYAKAKGLFSYTKAKSFWGSEKRTEKEEFSSVLGTVLTQYQMSKRSVRDLQLALAEKCFKYIVWANTFHVVKRAGLSNKIEALQKENAQLKEEKDKCQEEISRLTLLNEALHEAFDKLGIQRIRKNDKERNGETVQ